MFDMVWEAVSRLERMEFRVLGVTCDGASLNCRLWKLHGQKDEIVYKVPNVFAPGICILFLTHPICLKPSETAGTAAQDIFG